MSARHGSGQRYCLNRCGHSLLEQQLSSVRALIHEVIELVSALIYVVKEG
jgi:hypothetical protein